MRRFWNWAREVRWVNIIGVALVALGIAVALIAALLAAWVMAWGFLALVLVLAGIGILILGLRS